MNIENNRVVIKLKVGQEYNISFAGKGWIYVGYYRTNVVNEPTLPLFEQKNNPDVGKKYCAAEVVNFYSLIDHTFTISLYKKYYGDSLDKMVSTRYLDYRPSYGIFDE